MPTIAKRTVPIEHIRIQSTKSFIDVRAALERIVPPLDPRFWSSWRRETSRERIP
jgi:hypothetical protein